MPCTDPRDVRSIEEAFDLTTTDVVQWELELIWRSVELGVLQLSPHARRAAEDDSIPIPAIWRIVREGPARLKDVLPDGQRHIGINFEGKRRGGGWLRVKVSWRISSRPFMRYNGSGMMERHVEISETYVPGRNLGCTRSVTVVGIPAIEVTYEGVTEELTTFEVSDRVDTLIQRALRSNDHAEQHITYTPSDPGLSIDPRPWHERFSAPRRRRQSSISSSARVR